MMQPGDTMYRMKYVIQTLKVSYLTMYTDRKYKSHKNWLKYNESIIRIYNTRSPKGITTIEKKCDNQSMAFIRLNNRKVTFTEQSPSEMFLTQIAYYAPLALFKVAKGWYSTKPNFWIKTPVAKSHLRALMF